MLTGNLPRKSLQGKFNIRHKAAVRHHGDHEIEAKFVAPLRRRGIEVVVWKVREKHGAKAA